MAAGMEGGKNMHKKLEVKDVLVMTKKRRDMEGE